MTKVLDVLLLENQTGDGDADAARLEAAGHRVHRCWPERASDSERTSLRNRYLCQGVTSGSCPLVLGIDVVLLVRGRVASRPSLTEAGVSCGLRTGIPVVEDGPEILDPFEPWITARAGDDVVATCEAAAAQRAAAGTEPA